MKRNQFLNCNSFIQEIAAKTKKKSARITITIPDELAEKLMKQMVGVEDGSISGLQLTWLDHELPQVDK